MSLMPVHAQRGTNLRVAVGIQAAALLAVALISVVQHLCGQPSMADALHHWLSFDAQHDSWRPMARAYAWFASQNESTIYQEIFFRQHVKFQYPPSSLMVIGVPTLLDIKISEERLNALSWLAVVTEGMAVAGLFWVLAGRGANGPVSPATRMVGAVLACFLTLLFYPVLRAYELGQIQTWLNAAFALALLGYACGKRLWAGMIIGCMCLIKPQFGLFLIWALIRRERNFIVGLAIALIPGLAISLLWFGWQNHIDYLSAISFMSRHGEAYYPNQSFNGLVQRFLGNGNALDWQHSFPPFNPIVYYVTICSSLLIVTASLLGRKKGDLADFAFAALAFTIASPIAWEHHYGILPPILIMLLLALVRAPEQFRSRGALICLGLAYIASATFIAPTQFATTLGIGGLACSYLLFAGIVILVLLYYSSKHIATLAAGKIVSESSTS